MEVRKKRSYLSQRTKSENLTLYPKKIRFTKAEKKGKYCAIFEFRCNIASKLRFTKEELEGRNEVLPFVPARSIRNFDVISEVN